MNSSENSFATPGNQTLPVGYLDMSASVRVYFSRADLTDCAQETVHRHETAQTKLFTEAAVVPGVVMIVGKPYELVVQKAELYTWAEIHPKLLDLVLAANLGPMQPASDTKQ
jgi:hypothetical protein